MRTLTLFIVTAALSLGQDGTRTLHFVNLQTGPQFAEAATVIRSTGEIRDVTVDAGSRTMTVHATPEQAALSEWLFSKLDRTAGTMGKPDAAELDYRPAVGGPDDMVRVFYFRNRAPAADIQRMTAVIRSLTEIRRAFLSNSAGAFVVRGTREQLDTAKWLLESLDQPSLPPGVNQYRLSDAGGENIVRLFSVPKLGSEQELSNLASEVRAAAQMRRVFTYFPQRVIVVRSTAAQIEDAARLINRP